jgi:manganese transport protein
MKFPKIGPAFLITAVFIGLETIITAPMVGENYVLSPVWALLFAMFVTLINTGKSSALLGRLT